MSERRTELKRNETNANFGKESRPLTLTSLNFVSRLLTMYVFDDSIFLCMGGGSIFGSGWPYDRAGLTRRFFSFGKKLTIMCCVVFAFLGCVAVARKKRSETTSSVDWERISASKRQPRKTSRAAIWLVILTEGAILTRVKSEGWLRRDQREKLQSSIAREGISPTDTPTIRAELSAEQIELRRDPDRLLRFRTRQGNRTIYPALRPICDAANSMQ